jgi:hypothetical protein
MRLDEEPGMRKPAGLERLYVDFDSFFASAEQHLQPRLRGISDAEDYWASASWLSCSFHTLAPHPEEPTQ